MTILFKDLDLVSRADHRKSSHGFSIHVYWQTSNFSNDLRNWRATSLAFSGGGMAGDSGSNSAFHSAMHFSPLLPGTGEKEKVTL